MQVPLDATATPPSIVFGATSTLSTGVAGVGGPPISAPVAIPTLSMLGLALFTLLAGLLAWPALSARAVTRS